MIIIQKINSNSIRKCNKKEEINVIWSFITNLNVKNRFIIKPAKIKKPLFTKIEILK